MEWSRERRLELQCRFKKEELSVILVVVGEKFEVQKTDSTIHISARLE